jgi:hypothetical protein
VLFTQADIDQFLEQSRVPSEQEARQCGRPEV